MFRVVGHYDDTMITGRTWMLFGRPCRTLTEARALAKSAVSGNGQGDFDQARVLNSRGTIVATFHMSKRVQENLHR